MKHLAVEDAFAGAPLDEFLAAHWPRVAKGRLRGLVRDGLVTIDGLPAQPADRNAAFHRSYSARPGPSRSLCPAFHHQQVWTGRSMSTARSAT